MQENNLLKRYARNRRGASLALVALGMPVLLGLIALGVDMGMMFSARAEAQRAADSGALAAAGEFLRRDPSDATVVADAVGLAHSFAESNTIRGQLIDSTEVQVDVKPADRRIRVIVRRTIPTWFAKILGVGVVDVAGVAVAEATQSGGTDCIIPFAIPDLWDDSIDDIGDDNIPYTTVDEDWIWNASEGDRYAEHGSATGGVPDMGSCPDGHGETGYGSCARTTGAAGVPFRDWGYQIKTKVSDPNDLDVVSTGSFFPIRLYNDEGKNQGGKVYEGNIANCSPESIGPGDTVRVENGNMIGPTEKGVDVLEAKDPNTTWDEAQNGIVDANGNLVGDSERVVKVLMFGPDGLLRAADGFDGSQNWMIVVSNVALMYIEEQPTRSDPVKARFMYYGEGTEGPDSMSTNSLIMILRLIDPSEF